MQASQLHTISLGPGPQWWTLLQNFVSAKTLSWVEKFCQTMKQISGNQSFYQTKPQVSSPLQKQAHNFKIFILSHLNSYILIVLLLNPQTFPWIIYSRTQYFAFYSPLTPKNFKVKMNLPSLLHELPQLPYFCFLAPWHILIVLMDQSKHHNSKRHQAPNFPSWQTLINNGNKKTPQNEWREKSEDGNKS